MNWIFDLEYLRYWELLCEYINPLKVLIWAVIGGLLGLIIGFVLMICLRKKIMIQRRYLLLRIISYTYWVAIPLLLGFCAMQWSALHNAERQVVKNIPKYLGETNTLFNTYLRAEVEKIVSEEIRQSNSNQLLERAVSGVQKIAGAYLKDWEKNTEGSESELDKTANVVSSYLAATIMESSFVREKVVTEVRKKIGDALLMNEKLTYDLFEVEFQHFLDDGVVNTVLEKHVCNIFGGFKMNAWLLLLLGMLFPILEIGIANWLSSKEKDSITPEDEIDQESLG